MSEVKPQLPMYDICKHISKTQLHSATKWPPLNPLVLNLWLGLYWWRAAVSRRPRSTQAVRGLGFQEICSCTCTRAWADVMRSSSRPELSRKDGSESTCSRDA